MPDIAAPLEQEGNVTQAVIQPAISGAEITRLSMYKADALKELAAGYDKLGAGIASGVNAALSGIGAGNSDDMARQGALAGRSAVTRDANGDIQVQPTTGELFGGGGKQYANAVSDGTQQQITTNLKSDLNEIAAKNEGNPEGLKAAIAGYLQGHTGGLGAGVAGKTALLDAQDYGQQLYDHQLSRKAATDIGQAKGALQGTIDQTQGDLVALAQGGMAGSDEFAKTLGRQSDAYNSLTGNPAFGVSRDMADQNRHGNSLAVTSATIQGSMATAFKDGGINAATAVIPSIDDYPGASDADKVQLKTAASAYLQKLQASNKTAIAANSDAFDAWNKAGENGAKPPLDVLQGIHNQAVALGDPDTAAKTSVAIATHNYSNATSGLSPSQHDTINGVGQPSAGQPSAGATLRPNFFSSGRAQAAGFSFDPNHPDLTTVTAANGLTAQVNKFAAPAFEGFIKDLEARGYNINDLGGYNNREKRGGTTLSEHAFGNAIDINPSQNSFGGNKTNMPPDVSQIAAKWGLSWGGDWQGKKDFMHFEWTGVAGGGVTQLARGPLAEGSRSFVNSNPGNIKFGDFASAHGATGQDAKGFAIFPNEAAGVAAQRALWDSSDYANAPLNTALAKWSGNGYTAQQLGFQPNQTFASLSEPDKQRLLAAQRQHEGWVPGGGTRVASGASGALPGAPTMTWDDLKNNPYASAAYARTLAADEATRTRTGGALIDSSVRGMQNGSMPSQQTMVQIEQLAADNPKLADKYEKYETELGGHALANQSFAPIGGGAGGQPLIDQARAAAVAQPDILQRQIVDKAQEIRDKSERTLKDNPVAAALNGRWIGRAPAPLDPGNPQSYAQHFADNAAVVNAIAAREPNADKSAVFPNELGTVQGIVSGGTLQQKVALLGNIARLPSPIREATFAKIASTGAEGAVMAQAGAVAQGSPEAAQDILQGQAILKTEPRFAPPAKDMLPAFAKVLPPMDFPATGARGRFLDAAKAYYAAQSAKINDTSEVFDNDRWKQAVNAVTGGVLDHNGTKVIAPVYGMSQGDFDAKISGLTDADMQGAMLGGRQFPAIGLAKAGWFTSNPYHLQTLDPDAGTYLVMGGAKGAPSIVNDGAGRPLILNLRTPGGTMQAQQ